jgi:hypothetical protein
MDFVLESIESKTLRLRLLEEHGQTIRYYMYQLLLVTKEL